MRFFNVARGPERENKQCVEMLLISTSDIGDVFLLEIFNVFIYSDRKQNADRNEWIINSLETEQNILKENSYCIQICIYISSIYQK